MNLKLKRISTALAGASLITLAGCGGGGGGGAGGPAAPVASTLCGTVATGAAIANAAVAITDSNGTAACSNAPIQATATGTYSCTLNAGAAAPLVIVATDPAGVADPLVSLVSETPAAGTTTTANVTPLTNAVAAMLAPNRNPLALVPADAASDAERATRKADLIAAAGNLASQVKALIAQLQNVLTQAGITDTANFNPFTTPFVARSAGVVGGAGDKLLDIVNIELTATADGSPALAMSNRFDAAAPILLAAAGTVSPPTVASVVATGFTIAELDFAAKEFEKCFAVPKASRVLGTALAPAVPFSKVTSVAPECQNFASSTGKTGAGTDFKNFGYSAEEYFYGMLTNTDMDGAKFNLPEMMRFISRTDGKDEAVLNIKFRDKNGNAANRILLAKKFPGSDASSGRNAGTDWWLYGNQRVVEAYIQSYVSRRVQMAPNAGMSGPFANQATSRYQTGVNIFINRFGPGSANLRYMRVKGPGLPTGGLVYAQPPVFCGSDSTTLLSILNKTGTIPVGTAQTTNVGNLFVLQRTKLDGSPYAMPSQSIAAPTGGQIVLGSAHPADYGKVMPSGNFIDFSTLPAWTSYTFELFYNAELTPSVTFSASIVTPVQAAAVGLSQQWQDFSSDSLQYLDPSLARAAAQPKFDISWTRNVYADRVSSLGIYTGTSSGGVFTAVNQLVTGVGFGVTAVSPLAPTGSGCGVATQFPALTGDGLSSRTFQMRYQRLDGSYKDSLNSYN